MSFLGGPQHASISIVVVRTDCSIYVKPTFASVLTPKSPGGGGQCGGWGSAQGDLEMWYHNGIGIAT